MSLKTKFCRVQSPCRIDFAGGTADLWPLYLHLDGIELVHAGIGLYATAELKWQADGEGHRVVIESSDISARAEFSNLKDLHASLLQNTQKNPLRWLCRLAHNYLAGAMEKSEGSWHLKCSSQVPPGSGLGGSSVLGVSVAKAFSSFLAPESEGSSLWLIQERVRNLEAAEIEFPAGEQDYIPALFGGFLITHLRPQKKSIERIDQQTAKELLDRCLLIYTGKPHHSGINNWQIFSSFHEGVTATRTSLRNICAISKQMAEELRHGRLEKMSDLINLEWEERLRLGDKVNAPVLDEAWAFAKQCGAVARKGCGAGGGGCMLFLFPDAQSKLAALKVPLPQSNWSWMNPEISSGPRLEIS